MNNKLSEYENKYVMPNHLAGKVRSWLNLVCPVDPDYPVGVVSSIYFDTPAFSMLDEKINSDYYKTKVRLRWYNQGAETASGQSTFLEVKNRFGCKRIKLRLNPKLNLNDINEIELNDPLLMRVNETLKANSLFFPGIFFPVLLIQHNRHRFLDPSTRARICIDSDIRVTKTNRTMLPSSNCSTIKEAVFEHKGKDYCLPNLLHQLTAFGCLKSSFSKYSVCYQHLKRNYGQD